MIREIISSEGAPLKDDHQDSPSVFKEISRRIDVQLSKLGFLPAQSWEDIQVVFIVSTGRTGTKFFGKLLRQYDWIYPCHEPQPSFLNTAIKHAAGKISPDYAADIIDRGRRMYKRDVKRNKKSLYVESNNRLFSLLVPLRRVLPDSKIIHIVRDGRDYVRSGMSRIWYKKGDNHKRSKANMFPNDSFYEGWKNMTRFEKVCWRWQKKDSIIRKDISKMENTLRVKFESLFERKETEEWKRVLKYIDGNISVNEDLMKFVKNNKTNKNSSYDMPKWAKWNQSMKNKFNKISGKNMKKILRL